VEIENQIQLTNLLGKMELVRNKNNNNSGCPVRNINQMCDSYVSEIAIQYLDKMMNCFQCDQFIVVLVNTCHELQTGVSVVVW
jgi:hypothetical protein